MPTGHGSAADGGGALHPQLWTASLVHRTEVAPAKCLPLVPPFAFVWGLLPQSVSTDDPRHTVGLHLRRPIVSCKHLPSVLIQLSTKHPSLAQASFNMVRTLT